MQRSFKARIEALERQHYTADYPGDLTVEDCTQLLFQIGLSNVRLDADGRARRQWRCHGEYITAQLDQALLCLNAMLAVHPEPPIDTEHLAYGLARYVEVCNEKL